MGALNPKGMAVKGPKLGCGGFKPQRNGSKGPQNDPKMIPMAPNWGVGALNPKGMAVKGPKLGCGGCEPQRNGSKGSQNDPKGPQIGVWGL